MWKHVYLVKPLKHNSCGLEYIFFPEFLGLSRVNFTGLGLSRVLEIVEIYI